MAGNVEVLKQRFMLLKVVYKDETLSPEDKEKDLTQFLAGNFDDVRPTLNPFNGLLTKSKRLSALLSLRWVPFRQKDPSKDPITPEAYTVAKRMAEETANADFLAQLFDEPDLLDHARMAEEATISTFSDLAQAAATTLGHRARQVHVAACLHKSRDDAEAREKEELDRARGEFVAEINKLASVSTTGCVFVLSSLN